MRVHFRQTRQNRPERLATSGVVWSSLVPATGLELAGPPANKARGLTVTHRYL